MKNKKYFKKIDYRFKTAKRPNVIKAVNSLGYKYFSEAIYYLSKEYRFKEIAIKLNSNRSTIGSAAKLMGVKPIKKTYWNTIVKSYSDMDDLILYKEDIYLDLAKNYFNNICIAKKEFKPMLDKEETRDVGCIMESTSEIINYLYEAEKLSIREIHELGNSSYEVIRRILIKCQVCIRSRGGANFKGKGIKNDKNNRRFKSDDL